MPDTGWKAYERRIMALLHGVRRRLDGERAGADGCSGLFAVQCKKGRNMPAYLHKWLVGIETWARRRKIHGIVVWQRRNYADLDSIVVMRLSTLIQLMEDLDELWFTRWQAVGLDHFKARCVGGSDPDDGATGEDCALEDGGTA